VVRNNGLMNVRHELPYAVDVIDHKWITMDDGVRLSVKLWLPRTSDRVPVLLEYLPYRKDDFTYERDSAQHGYFAGHGYATARVDIRGTGDSEGILEDEYLQLELDDGVTVIEWLARQKWCSGNVGMFGISWGGFNSLQIAAMAPQALKAVIAVAATDDRYATDVHYHGGALLACEMLPWAATMFVRNAIPPTPAIAGDGWHDQWLQRLEKTPRFIESWLSHQRRDDYWRHGSVTEDVAAIKCPVYIVGGLADGYSDTVLRLAADMGSQAKALLGPWSHNFPEFGVPGPNIGFLQEALRWWDHWMRGVDTGIADEEPVRIWVQDWVEPGGSHTTRPGRWITEPSWPPPKEHTTEVLLWPATDTLATAPPTAAQIVVAGAQSHGAYGGRWWGYGGEGDLPGDQERETSGAESFDSEPVEAATSVIGFPEVHLRLSVQSENGIVAAQLSDVAPDGRALLVARGVLNLSHRTGHEHPEPMVPDEPTDVTVVMNAAAHRIPPGHRWRLTISTAYWPFVWPLPDAAPLVVDLGDSSYVSLPVRHEQDEPAGPPAFGLAERAPSDLERNTPPVRSRLVTSEAGVTTITDVDDSGEFELTGRVIAAMGGTDGFSITEDDPLTARVMCTRHCALAWEEADVLITTRSEMWATRETWHVVNSIEAHADAEKVFDRRWEFDVPRDWT
jgi:putative CocE/NonD family hydrolase